MTTLRRIRHSALAQTSSSIPSMSRKNSDHSPPEPLHLAHVAAGGQDPLAHLVELVARLDGEREVIDRTTAALTALFADDLVGRHLEGVEGRASARGRG